VLHIHVSALNVYVSALNVYVSALNVHISALNVHVSALNVHVSALSFKDFLIILWVIDLRVHGKRNSCNETTEPVKFLT
jgi:hypothetical protein